MEDYESFLAKVGGFGKYQKKVIFIVFFSSAISAFCNMDFVLITAEPKHWCKAPVVLDNLTEDMQKLLTIPRTESEEYNSCYMFNNTSWMLAEIEYMADNDNVSLMELQNLTETGGTTVRCTEWEYDRTVFKRTIVSQWNLVCGREALAATATAIFGAGKAVGSIVAGGLADRFGRRPILVSLSGATAIIGILSAFSPDPVTFCIACFFKGMLNNGATIAAHILAIELVSTSYRVPVVFINQASWVVGCLITAAVTWLTKDWFTQDLILYTSSLVFVILFAWLIPESPRWLLRIGQRTKALEIMKKMAEVNGTAWDKKFEDVQDCETKKQKVTLAKLTRSDTIVIITIINCFIWFANNMVYYGLSYNSSNLVGNIYLNFFVLILIEIPGYIACWVCAERFGRQRTILITLSVSAVALLATVPLPADLSTLATIFAVVGKFAITIAFCVLYISTPEMYPTEYRSSGFGLSNMIGRLGAILAPYMALLGTISSREVPLILFGAVSAVAALSALLLPETKGRKLPENLSDIRRLQDDMMSCSCRKATSIQVDGNGSTQDVEQQDFITTDEKRV